MAQSKKQLVMSEAEFIKFKLEGLKNVPYPVGEQIVNYLSQFVKDTPEQEEKKSNP